MTPTLARRKYPKALELRGKAELPALEQVASGLADSITQDISLDAARKEFLQGEVGAMQTVLRLLQGESMGIIEEVERLYGITPQWIDKSLFDKTHQLLNELLPGSDPLADRVQAFRDQLQVPAEIIAPFVEKLAQDLRARTRKKFSLPPDEGCKFEYVYDKPWGAYNWYLGNYTHEPGQFVGIDWFAISHSSG